MFEEFDDGILKIKCVKPGGYTLTNYGQYHFNEQDEIDLLDTLLPATIRCSDWWTANNICNDNGYEIAQLIIAGYFIITESRKPQKYRS